MGKGKKAGNDRVRLDAGRCLMLHSIADGNPCYAGEPKESDDDTGSPVP